ncbi:MAG: hypothetical protein RIC35_02335 [Marinoscillum sp.]
MKTILSIVFLSCWIGLQGQSKLVFSYEKHLEEIPMVHPSQKQTLINSKLMDLWSRGFLYSGVDSVAQDTVYLHLGNRLAGEVSSLRLFNQDEDEFENIPVGKSEELEVLLRKTLNEYSDSGHPFVQIKLREIDIDHDAFTAAVEVYPGPVVRFDSIALLGDVGIGRKFLARALEVESGKLYSEQIYRDIPYHIQRLPFLSLESPTDITFSEGKTTIYLNLKERKENSFEGVVGLLPRQSAEEKLAITGYLDLGLTNLFKSGKSLNFTWNRFADESQSVDLAYYHPYFLSTPLFVGVEFDLLKQDTSFLTQRWLLQTGAFIGKRSEITMSYESANGSLINPEELDIAKGVADYKSGLYSLGFGSSFYARPLILKNQIKYHVRTGLGEKRIVRNPSVQPESYDTLMRNSRLVKLSGGFKYLFRFTDRLALFHQMEGELFFNNQVLLNELTRVGGLRTVRGFNENFFYAQHYAFSRLEMRQYFERSSYFMAFYDQLIYRGLGSEAAPTGFGLGLTLDTSNGLFTFATAMGYSSNIPLDPNNIKIHLGYTSRF